MGLFEEQPWLLVPFVLVIVVGYDVVKWGIRRLLDREPQPEPQRRRP
jgi:hypothetical protein